MINSLRVRCFKAIADSNELPLGPLTCLIGRTGSGKSSLIDALDWLSHACAEGLAGATQHFTNHSDLIRHGSLTFELELKYDPGDVSIGDEVVYKVGVGARPDGQPFVLSESLTQRRGGDISERIRTESGRRERRVPVASNITRSTVTEFREGKSSELEPLQRYVDESAWSAYDDDSRLALTLMDPTFERGGTSLVEFLERSVFLRLNPKAMASFGAMYVPSSERLLDDEGRNLAFLLSQLPEDALADLLEKLSFVMGGERRLSSHKPTLPSDRRFFEVSETIEGTEALVPAWALSEGCRRVTALLALIYHPAPPPLLCIEEVENGLDPWTLDFMIKELINASLEGTQILLTSHSQFLLNRLPYENIVLARRTENGTSFSAIDVEALGQITARLGPGDLYTNDYFWGRD